MNSRDEIEILEITLVNVLLQVPHLRQWGDSSVEYSLAPLPPLHRDTDIGV